MGWSTLPSSIKPPQAPLPDFPDYMAAESPVYTAADAARAGPASEMPEKKKQVTASWLWLPKSLIQCYSDFRRASPRSLDGSKPAALH
jgi:hypothetical protein